MKNSVKTLVLETSVENNVKLLGPGIEVKKSFKGIRTGRKIDPNSARQKRLAEAKAKLEAGVQVKKGRPVVEGSARQIRLQELEAKRVDGQIKRGRNVDPNSARQIRLRELEARRANGEVKRGRPTKQKEEEVSLIDMLKAKS
jgi:hypothetical protein